MIRINLLPIKQDRRREAGRNQLIIAALILLIEAGAFFGVQMKLDTEVEAQRNANDRIKAKVERIQKQIKDHQLILDEIAEYEKRQQAIEELQSARTGPVFVMLELSNLISRGGRPHIDHDKYQEMIQLDPHAGYDENWDYRRLWISSLTEKNRSIQLSGQALTHEDVAEFLRRINLSDFFVQSSLVSTSLKAPSLPGMSPKDADPAVHFSLNTKVRYN